MKNWFLDKIERFGQWLQERGHDVEWWAWERAERPAIQESPLSELHKEELVDLMDRRRSRLRAWIAMKKSVARRQQRAGQLD